MQASLNGLSWSGIEVGVSDNALGMSGGEKGDSGRGKDTLGLGSASLMEWRRRTDLRLMMGLERMSTNSTEWLLSTGEEKEIMRTKELFQKNNSQIVDIVVLEVDPPNAPVVQKNSQEKLQSRVADSIVIQIEVLDGACLQTTKTKHALLIQPRAKGMEKGRLDVTHP